MNNEENVKEFSEPKLKSYKSHIYEGNTAVKTIYNIIFEGDDCCAQKYLNLLVRLLSYIEHDLKKEKPHSLGYANKLFALANDIQFEPLCQECAEMGIDVGEAILYILNRATKDDFQYPLVVFFGDQVGFIEPICEPKKGMRCSIYKPELAELKAVVQQAQKLEADDLAADKSFMDIFTNNNA